MEKRRSLRTSTLNAALDDWSESESDTESVPHHDHFVKHILETVAIKKLHATHDLNQLFLSGLNQVAVLAEEWSAAHAQGGSLTSSRSHNQDVASFVIVLEKIKLILNILQGKDKISYWTQGQNDFAVRLLLPVNIKLMKLARKLERLSTSFHDTMLTLKPIVDSGMYHSESKLNARIGGRDESFSYKMSAGRSPTMLKTLRKSLRNLIVCGAGANKENTPPAPSRKDNSQDPDEDLTQTMSSTTNRSSELNGSQSTPQDDGPAALTSETPPEFQQANAEFRNASRQVAVVQTNLFRTEAGNGEAKEVVAEMNRQALIDRIVSEADAKWRPVSDVSEARENEDSAEQDSDSDSEAEFLASPGPSSPPPEEQSPFTESQAETRDLLLILKNHAKYLEGKVHGTTQNLRDMEKAFYTLQANDSQFIMKSEPDEAQELAHLVDILKEVGRVFLEYPQIQAVLSSHLRYTLQTDLSELRENGKKFCTKLEGFSQAVQVDCSRLQAMLNSCQKGDLFVYEYSSNFGLNSFSNIGSKIPRLD